MSRTRTLVSLALGALASAAYLAVVARDMSLEALARAFASVAPLPCALYVTGFAVVMRARAERLAASLAPLRPTRAAEVMPSQMAGYLANFVLPMQAGELARIAVAVRGLGVPAGAMVSAMAVERVVDLLFALAAVAVALGGLAWATLQPAAVRRTVAAVAARLPVGLGGVLRSQADACCDGLAVLRDPAFLMRYLGWSVLQWLGWVASVAATLLAAGIEVEAATTVLCSALVTGAGVALAPRISRAQRVPPAAPRRGRARSTRGPDADPRACGRRPRARP
ncbi:MAG: lysylphosphatidylglycerol synthase domain-containing protein [Burkholderiales bacterium]